MSDDYVPEPSVLRDLEVLVDPQILELRDQVESMTRHIRSIESTNDRLLRIIENLSSRRYE